MGYLSNALPTELRGQVCSSVWYFGTKSSTFDTNVFYDHDIFCVCFDVMYSGEYNVFDVTLSVYPHWSG